METSKKILCGFSIIFYSRCHCSSIRRLHISRLSTQSTQWMGIKKKQPQGSPFCLCLSEGRRELLAASPSRAAASDNAAGWGMCSTQRWFSLPAVYVTCSLRNKMPSSPSFSLFLLRFIISSHCLCVLVPWYDSPVTNKPSLLSHQFTLENKSESLTWLVIWHSRNKK